MHATHQVSGGACPQTPLEELCFAYSLHFSTEPPKIFCKDNVMTSELSYIQALSKSLDLQNHCASMLTSMGRESDCMHEIYIVCLQIYLMRNV